MIYFDTAYMLKCYVSETGSQEVLRMFETLPREVYLRTGDAIHLACARENGFVEIYTNDRHLKLAASHWGLTACDVVV